MSQFSIADINTDRLTAQARWTLENLALPMIEDDLSLDEAASRHDLVRRDAGKLMQALREECVAQRNGAELPGLRQDDYEALRESIRAFGQQVPILLDQHGHILDGNHRMRACRDLALEPLTRTVQVADAAEGRAIGFVVNMARRHLTTKDKRNAVAAELFRDPARSDRDIAGSFGISPTTVGKTRRELATRSSLSNLDMRRGRDGRVINTAGIGQQAELPPAQPIWDQRLAGEIALSILCDDGTTLTVHRRFTAIAGLRSAAAHLTDELAQKTHAHYTAGDGQEDDAA